MAAHNLPAPIHQVEAPALCDFAKHRPIVTTPHWSIAENGRARTTCRICRRQIERLPPDGDGGWQWWGTPEQCAAVEAEERAEQEHELRAEEYAASHPEDRCPPRE